MVFRVWLTSHWFPNGYAVVPVILQLDMVKFLSNSDNGKFLQKEGSRYRNFSAGILLPSFMHISGRFRHIPAWKRPELAGKITVSCRIRWRESSTWEYKVIHLVLTNRFSLTLLGVNHLC
jgi:hypothetical protein